MQQVYTRSETDCIYATQVQLSHTPIPPARTDRPALAAPSRRDMLLGCLGSCREKKSPSAGGCWKARLSLQEASSQVVVKLRPPKVPERVSTSVNENSAPTKVSHNATPSKTAQGYPPHKLNEEEKGTQGTPISEHHGPYRSVNQCGLSVQHKSSFSITASSSPPIGQQQITEFS